MLPSFLRLITELTLACSALSCADKLPIYIRSCLDTHYSDAQREVTLTVETHDTGKVEDLLFVQPRYYSAEIIIAKATRHLSNLLIFVPSDSVHVTLEL